MRIRVRRTISLLLVLVNILGLMPINAFSTDVEANVGAETAIVTEAPAEAQPAPSVQEPAPQTEAPAEEESSAPSAEDPAPAQEPEASVEPSASQEPTTAPEPSATEATPTSEVPAVTEEPETTEEPSAEDSSEEADAEEPEEGEEEEEEEEDEKPQGDPTADLETAATWESTIPFYRLNGNWAEDLITVASSQIGYAESTKNFIYDEEDNQQGYTRYGAWYGAPYAEWCAMFVSFCLNYAGIPSSAFPYNASCPAWVSQLSGLGMYRSAGGYDPQPGDIIFFEEDGDGLADHVGIVSDVTDGSVTVIEGNCNKQVMRKTYSRSDGRITGYGVLPENPAHPKEVPMPAATLSQTAADGTVITADIPEGALPEGVEMVVVPQSAEQVFAELLRQYGYDQETVDATVDAMLENGEAFEDYIAAYDISFCLPSDPDTEIEPLKAVSVTFENVSLKSDLADLDAYHVADSGEVSSLNPSVAAGGEAVTVSVDSFSEIIIADNDVFYTAAALMRAGSDTRDEGQNTSANIMDFIPPGTITLVHADGTPVNDANPAVPGETVRLALSNIAETPGGRQFDMDELTLNIPDGIEVPATDVTGDSPVTVKDVDGQIYDLPNTYVIGADGVIRYIWKNPWTVERAGVVHDVYDLACRVENFSFSLSFEMTIGTDADNIQFSDDISFPVDRSVSLTVTKAISGVSTITPTQAEQMVFGLFDEDGKPVKDKDGNNITFTRDNMTGTLANAKYEITGLTAEEYPATFIVRETGHPEIEGYTFMTTGANVVTEMTVTIPAGQSATANLKNRYTKDVSHLKVKKVFPEGSNLNYQNLTTAQKQKISFKVYDADNTLVAEALLSETTKFDANGEWDLGTLPPGEYTVVETADLEGYTETTTYKVDTNAETSGTSASVTLVKDGNHVVQFNNTYTEQRDKLKLKKTFAGAPLPASEKANITFTITCPDGSTITKHYSDFDANGELVLENVLTGTYTVAETNENPNTANYTVTSTYAVNGGTPASGTTANNVAVTLNGTNEVDFVNTYTAVGKITLSKTVGGDYWTDFGASYDTQKGRRTRIRSGVVFNLYRVENGTRTYVGQKKLSDFYSGGSTTWSNLPVGTYEIDEVISGTGNTGAIISNTVRTTTVTVNGGTGQTAADDATTISTGSFSVTKGGTSTVAYQNDYNKKKGKIKLDKEVFIDGSEVDPSTLTEKQQKDMKFTVTGKDIFGHDVSKVVSLYDILHPTAEGSPLDEDGYLVLDYSNTTNGYTVTESGADLTNYIRVTTGKLDSGEYGPGTAVSSVAINATTTEHTVTFKNEYTASGRLKILKTVTGLSAAEEAEVRAQIYFTIADASTGRPIVLENGKYKLGQTGDTPAQISLADMVTGIDIPTGTYKITEHNYEYNTDYYNCSVSNLLIVDGGTIYTANSPVSGNTEVLLGNEKLVQYTNRYTRVGVGNGVTVNKKVWLDGVEIGANSEERLKEFDALVKGQIRFKIYEGSEVDESKLFGEYTYAQLQANPPMLYVGTWTIQETNYEIAHYNHAIRFTVDGSGTSTIVSETDHVTFTLAKDSRVGIEVINAYIPLGNLEVQKLFGEKSDLNAENLTVDQKKAIQFSVIGYKDTTYSKIVWPEQDPNNTEAQPYVFSYNDMTLNDDGIMSKLFEDIPTGVYVVTEDGAIENYNVTTVSNPDGNGISVPYNELAVQKFTNTYTRQKGNLEVQKTFEAPSTLTTEKRSAITFTVTGPDPSMPQTFTYAQMTDGKKTFENVITGEYTVKETNADVDYFERTTTVSVNSGEDTTYSDANGATASVESEQTASVHITNEYKETGALIINKTFDDSECISRLTDAQKNGVEFTIWRVSEDDSPNQVIRTITYDEIVKWIGFHPDQAPAGYRILVLPGEYIIEESKADIKGYTRTTTATVDGTSATVSEDCVSTTVVKFDEQTVEFNNKYNEIGNLKIKKTVEGLTFNDEQKAAVTFTVTQGDTVIATFTYADILALPKQEYVISDLPAGEYTVSETVTDEASIFYGNTRRTYVKVGTAGETANSTTNVTVERKEKVVTFRNVYGNSDKLTVQKEIGGAPKTYIEKDGSNYPVWKFNLKIANLQPSTTSNGSTDLIDTYDRDLLGLFKIVTDPADLALISAADPDAASIANKLVPDGEGTVANVTLIEDYDNGKVTFRIDGVTEDTAKSNDLTYYLIPKDAVALEALNTRDNTVPEGTPPNELKKYFSNVVEYKELPLYDYIETNKVDYQYEKTVVIKRCLNYNAETKHLEDDYGHIVDYALYEFIINPERMKLSTEGYIDVTDVFSENQSVDAESITVQRFDPATETATDIEDGDVTYKDLVGHSIVLKVKDETCFKVTYKATILYTAEQVGQPVELNNTVTVEGYNAGIVPTIIPTSEGSGSVYQIRLRKYQNGNIDNTLKGAEFKMFLDKTSADEARESGDYSQAIGTYTTDQNGVVLITEYTDAQGTHHITADKANPIIYYFVESVAPTGYDKINYTVQVQLAAEGETADYEQYIYLPSDTVGIKDTPFDTMIALGALKTFKTNGSARKLEEGEFTFQIRAKNNANIPMPEQTEVSNDADGKAVFGAIGYDTEDVVTRDPRSGEVTSRFKTFVYEVSEVLPSGLDANGNKDGVHYDTHVYEVAVTVAVSDANTSLKVTSVKVDGVEVNRDSDNYEYHDASTDPETVTDVDLYFAGLENEYTAEGTWTPVIRKDLKGRPLKEGEFTFQIRNADDEVVASGRNNADGTVEMTPASLKFTLADLGDNQFTVHEVYEVATNDDDGMKVVAADVPVTVTVSEKQNYDGTLEVTSDPPATLTAPIVMTNEYEASGSWHPKAEKTMDGVLKINEGDFKFELAAVGNAPMPEGAVDGKLVVACDADGKVDFGQIDFYQDKDHQDGDKEFHYTIKEVIPDQDDRIFGVEYDNTVYNITVKTTINKTNKLGVAVTCTPATGWNVDESTAIFTAQFTNTYGPTPAEATPGYKKSLEGEAPSTDVTFEFKIEKAAGDNGDFDYVKVDENGALKPFAVQTKTLTLGPSSLTASGLFDKITFLAEGTYKFKITETPNTNGALDQRIVYDPKVYTYTVEVKGVGENLQATGTYSFVGEDQTEQTAETAAFTNKYTPKFVTWAPKAKKLMTGEPTVAAKTFTFTLQAASGNPAGASLTGTDTIPVTVPKGATASPEEAFKAITFTKKGTYTFTAAETPDTAGDPSVVTYDDKTVVFVVKVKDANGELEIESVTVDADLDHFDQTGNAVTAKFTNKYTPKPVTFQAPVEKRIINQPTVEDKTFYFTLEADPSNKEGGASLTSADDPLEVSIKIPKGQTGVGISALFDEITFYKYGTYQFTVREKGTADGQNLPGITYSDVVYTLSIDIKDIGDELKVDSYVFKPSKTPLPDSDVAKYENDYTPEPTQQALQARKKLTGEPLYDAENTVFTFELKDVTGMIEHKDGYEMPENPMYKTVLGSAVEANADGATAVFDEIKFTEAGKYYFQIIELDDSANHSRIYYDDTTWYVEVVVEDKDGYLEVTSVKYQTTTVFEDDSDDDSEEPADDPDAAEFNGADFGNDYNPDDTHFTPKVTKIVEGEPRVPESTVTFEFQLEWTDGPTDAEGNLVGAEFDEDQMTVYVTDSGWVPMGEITFTKGKAAPGPTTDSVVYTFEIKETRGGNEDYYTNDEHLWILTVEVADNDGILYVKSYQYTRDGEVIESSEAVIDEDGNLTPVEKTKNGATFTNIYTPVPTQYTPQVIKSLDEEAQPLFQKETFEFVMTAKSVVTDGSYVLEASTEEPEEPEELPVEENGEPEDKTFVKDGDSWTRTITVQPGETPEPALFDEFEYCKAGSYVYEITETVTGADGWTYSTDVWTVTVDVIDNGGYLDNTVSYSNGEKVSDEYAEFINDYQPIPVTYQAKVEKTVIGEPTVKDKTFTFTLEASKDNPEGASLKSEDDPLEVSVKIPAGATGEGIEGLFEEIEFTRAGTYMFIVKETEGELPGITYDGAVYDLTVVIKDTGGVLAVESTLYEAKDKEPIAEYASFENPYYPAPITVKPTAEKQLSGQTPTKDETFSFTLVAKTLVEGGSFLKANGTEIKAEDYWTKSIVGAGTVTFDEIEYRKAGQYTYEVYEAKGTAKGWSYSPAVWTITVTVTDTDGYLEYKIVYGGGDGSDATKIIFVNDYQPIPVEYVPMVEKTVTGEPTVKDKTFSFTLKASESNPEGASLTSADKSLNMSVTVPAGKTGEGIYGVFDAITFTKAGTYKFEIKETKEDETGFTYDDSVYTLTVAVIDNDGALEVKSTDYASGDASSSRYASFKNPYAPEPVSAAFEVEKKVTGEKASKSETFKFILTAVSLVEDGSYLKGDPDVRIKAGDSWEASVTGEGTTSFKEIEYCKAGKYTYEITEVDGKASGWTYSKAKWTVTVVVTDEDGVLSRTVSYKSAGVSDAKKATFTNEYHPDIPPKTGDDTPIMRYLMLMLISLIAMVAMFFARKKLLRSKS